MAKTTEQEWSKLNRLMIGDRVALNQGFLGSAHERLDHNAEGEVVGFANEERTYVEVDFDGTVETVTEEEVVRVS